MGKPTINGRVVVVARNDADTLDDCLSGISAQCPPGVDVVVVDQESTDGSQDVAIRHPATGRVLTVRAGDLDRVLDAACRETRRLLVIAADRRPGPGWVASGLAALDDIDLALGPDRDLGNLAIDLPSSRPVRLFSGARSVDDVLARARAAGRTSAVVDGLVVGPAAASRQRRQGLPVMQPPPATSRYEGTITVVLCTRDRPTHLKRCLDSLALLDDDDHEIVVVDNHPRPEVDPGTLPARGRLVHEPRPGLDVARNRGLAEATGDVVAYIDDDCEADPHWLGALRVAFADPDVSLVTGRVRPATLASPSQRHFESHFTFDRGPVRRRFTRWDRHSWHPLWPGPIGTGCNMAMRRELLAELGGFDELLDVGTSIGGGGDLDIFARFVDRGLLIEYSPEALVWHHHRDDPAALRRQFRGYGAAMGAFLTKSVLERPGLRITAARYFSERLVMRARLARDIRAGSHVLPMRLLLTDLIGQLTGPFLYLGARWEARRH